MNALVQWPADAVERRPVGALVPSARNARTHSDEQIAQLAASIVEWGWTMPVLIDEVGSIIAGHGRVLAALLLGIAEIPVMVARGWTEAQKRAYVIADNKLALNAGWDDALLRIEVADLTAMGFNIPLVGFSEQELAALNASENPGLTDPDAAPFLPTDPVARLGEIWCLGRHRLICGDCRDAATIDRLAAGRSVNLAFTSPPYAQQRDYDKASGFVPIKPDDYVEWFAPVAANVASHLAADGSWFVNIKPAAVELDTSLYVFDLVVAHVRSWGWHFATEFCWERGGMPKKVTRRFKNQFEPVYQFVKNDWKIRPEAAAHASGKVPSAEVSAGATKRKDGTTGNMANRQGTHSKPGLYVAPGMAYPGNRLPPFAVGDALGHAAAFPVGLPQFFCKAYTDANDVVFDPFCGTGSTLIAAQITNRIGLGCELSPAYVDVTIKRWQAFTGQRAVRETDGRLFDEATPAREAAA